MKNHFSSFIYSIWLGLIVCLTTGNVLANVDLYPQPKNAEIPVTSVDENSLIIKEALLRGTDKDGWCKAWYEGGWNGFVNGNAISSLNRVTLGTPVRLMPANASFVITTIESGDIVNAEPGTGWVKITLHKPIPLYFKKTANMKVEAPSAKDTKPSADDALQPYAFEGIFEQGSFVCENQKFRYQLRSKNGKIIGLLDLNNTVFADNLQSYIGHSVMIQGTIRPLGKSSVITAHSLQYSIHQ